MAGGSAYFVCRDRFVLAGIAITGHSLVSSIAGGPPGADLRAACIREWRDYCQHHLEHSESLCIELRCYCESGGNADYTTGRCDQGQTRRRSSYEWQVDC